MTLQRRSDRDLRQRLLDLYLEPAPAYRLDVLAQTQHMRQRSRWTFPERWLPMAVLSRTRVLMPRIPQRRALALLVILALVIAAVAAAIAGSPRYPAPFGIARNGQIVYSLDGDIYARDTVDAPARLLIGGDAVDEGPWYSRRGDRFIFLRTVATDTYDVFVADADGSDVRRVSGPYSSLDSWDVSPDGTRAVISSKVDRRFRIELVPLDGGPVTVLPTEGAAIWPRFRPGDGNWLSFRGGDPLSSGSMYLIRLDGMGLQKLDLRIDGVGGEHDFTHGMDWSQDGTQFAFVSIEDDLPEAGVDAGLRIDIASIGADGTVLAQRRQEFHAASDNELNPMFVPGTEKLMFNTREGFIDFVSMGVPGVAGGTILKPGSTGEQGIDYVISPDGTKALVLNRAERTTYEYDLRTLTSREVVLGTSDLSSMQRLAP